METSKCSNPSWILGLLVFSTCNTRGWQWHGRPAFHTFVLCQLDLKFNTRSLKNRYFDSFKWKNTWTSMEVINNPGWWFGCHFLFSQINWVANHPNWRTPIFQRGGPGPPTSITGGPHPVHSKILQQSQLNGHHEAIDHGAWLDLPDEEQDGAMAISDANHGAGIFTYITGPFLG